MMYSTFRFIPAIFKKRPIHFTFFVTRKCNQKCPFCFYLKGEAVPPALGREASPLGLEEIQKVSASLGSLLWVSFSGGEVYLRDDIVEISRVFYENNRPSILLYPTNGMLPELIREKTAEILRHCKKSVVVVKLSMDGINEKHDAIRGAPGSFQRVMKTYEMLSPLLLEYPNFELGINTVFCSLNQDSMDEIIDFVTGLKMIKTHTISLIRDNLKDNTYKIIDINKYLNACLKLEKNFKNNTASIYRFKGARLKAAQDILQRRLIYKTVTENRQIIPCYAGKLNLVMNEIGDVFPCEEFNKKLGNIRDYGYDMQSLLENEKVKTAVSSIKKNKCFCSHECYMMTNILFNPRTYQALLKEYL